MKFHVLLMLLFLVCAENSFSEAPFSTRSSSLDSFSLDTTEQNIDVNALTLQSGFPARAFPANGGFNSFRPTQNANSIFNSSRTNTYIAGVAGAYASAACSILTHKNSTESLSRINNYCSYLSGNVSACDGTGSSPEQRCKVGCVVKNRHLQQINSEMSDLPENQKVQACVDRVRNIIDTEPPFNPSPSQMQSGNTAARISALTELENRRARRAKIVEGDSLGCNTSTAGDLCDNFIGTALNPSSISQLATAFSTEYTTSKTGFLKLSTRGDCEKCMKEKFETSSQLSLGSSGDFNRKLKDFKEQKIIDIAARKANEAISNYLKFLERNDFMSRYTNTPKESCDGLVKLSSLPSSCRLSQKIVNKIKSGFGVQANASPRATLQSILTKTKDEMFNRKSTCGGDFDFDSFQSTRLVQVGDSGIAPNMWIDDAAEAKIRTCGEHDTNCFVDAMSEAYSKRLSSISVDTARATLISHMAVSPFFRTMISSRAGILSFKNMPTILVGMGDKVENYLSLHRAGIEEAAELDKTHACLAVENDLLTALCTNEDNVAENYTGEEIRTELATMINDNANSRGIPELYLELGTSCSILTSSKSHLGNSIPKVASMLAADREIAAIPFSNKGLSGFENTSDLFAEVADSACASSRLPAPGTFAGFPSALGSNAEVIVTANGLGTCNDTRKPFQQWNFSLPNCPEIPSYLNSSRGFDGLNLVGNSSGYNFGSFSPTNNWSLVGSYQSPIPLTNSSGNISDTDKSLKDNLTTVATSESVSGNVAQALDGATVNTVSTGMISTGTAEAFADLGNTGNPLQSTQTRQIQSNSYIGTYQPSVQIPQQIEMTNNISGTTLRKEESLVRQETDILKKVDNQGLENRELRDAVSQLRKEMTSMAYQNAQLLPTLQRMMAARGAKTEQVEEETLEEQEEISDEKKPKAKTTGKGRSPASVPATSRNLERGAGQTAGSLDGGSRLQGSIIGSNGQPGIINNSQENRGSQVFVAPVGNAVGVTVAAGGARGSSGMDRLVTRFTPSSQVTRQALGAGGTITEVGTEDKTQLVLEFLDYVKDFPLYRNGAYLSQANDSITVDYGGKEVVVKVDQIADLQTRSLVQERLISQRMSLNQQMRQSRLTELQRLLAEASDGL